MLPEKLTAGEVAARLGVKSGMVRRYALAFEGVTGIALEVDSVRGRLYPLPVVETLEAARAYLLAHPGESVEGALRAVTGQADEGAAQSPARVPSILTPAELKAALLEMLGEAQAPVLAALEEERERGRLMQTEMQKMNSELNMLRSEISAARAAVTGVSEQVRELPAPPPLAPVLDHLTAQAQETETLRAQVEHLTSELTAARSTVERLEVMTRAALPAQAPEPEAPRPTGVLGALARFLTGR